MSVKYISVNLYRKLIEVAQTEGMQGDDFANLATPVDRLDHIQAVPAEHFFELHEWLDGHLGPGFSVRAGQQMKIEDYGVLGLSWRTCSWAGEIFDRSERYFKLLSNTYVFKVDKQEDRSDVYLHREAWRRGVELSNEATFSATVVVLQAMTETKITPIEVAFRHAPPENQSSYLEAFQCPIHFKQPHNCISYKTHDLELRTAKADVLINRFLLERVEEETKGIEVSPIRISEAVQNLIKDALPSGIPSVAQVSTHMGMSTRTLTRRLADHGVTFRDLLQNTQEEVARTLLKHSARSVAEIAFETGFSEQSAFNRAFRRWTGQSPVEFRND